MEINTIVNSIITIIAGASLVAKGCELLSKYTATKKDDEFFLACTYYLDKIQSLLRLPAMNPKK